MVALSESTVEDAAPAWLEGTGWTIAHGPNIAPPSSHAGLQTGPNTGGWSVG